MPLLDLKIPKALSGNARLLRSASNLAGTKSLAQWERLGNGYFEYGAPNHHTLSVYLKGGRGVRRLNGSGRRATSDPRRGAPDAICVLPKDYETVWTNDSYVSMFHVYFEQAELEALMGQRVASLEPVIFGRDQILQATVRNLILALDWDAGADRLVLEHAILSLLARVLGGALQEEAGAGLTAGQLSRVEDLMRSEPAAAHSIAGFAAELDISPRHFARCFKASTGLTPGRMLRQARVERAIDLIIAGQDLAEVALDCGYSSQSHLTSQFKAETGMTPGQFRQRNRC
ncbi:AraC family transcriptional regulator [Pelagibius sp. Alg239-R121]|uniref:helix-turn-helix domain-containing protein n=1 Tax=Pelagibius sp. Alg239-R121 TaxID=2993448 RepID=UPI0024A77D97|nr:AraC family transcriptional regulator [Pelagibius sp. Alg239-R121]